jgi:hypothetical protein
MAGKAGGFPCFSRPSRLGARAFLQSSLVDGTFAQAWGLAENFASFPASPGNGAWEAEKTPEKPVAGSTTKQD